jgi:hypothetical protein
VIENYSQFKKKCEKSDKMLKFNSLSPRASILRRSKCIYEVIDRHCSSQCYVGGNSCKCKYCDIVLFVLLWFGIICIYVIYIRSPIVWTWEIFFITYLPPHTCFYWLYSSEGVAWEYTMWYQQIITWVVSHCYQGKNVIKYYLYSCDIILFVLNRL